MIAQKKKKRTSLSYQAIGAAVLAGLCLLLVATLIIINIVTSVRKVEIDGVAYYVRRSTDENGKVSYSITDKDKNPLTVTEDGYYVGESGALIRFDTATGSATKYAAIDTEGNEQVGINDRILIFPYTQRKDIQSIQVFNKNGNYAFYRMRTYEDTDKATYVCYLHNGEYYLVADDGTEYKTDSDGLYTLASGNRIQVHPVTGITRTVSYTDFDGKVYTVEKREGDEGYKLYSGDTALSPTLTKTGEKHDKDGNAYTDTLYSYIVTDYGTLVSVDSKTGILSAQALREYNGTTKKYSTYHFLYRDGKFLLCNGEGKLMTTSSIDDHDYYSTADNTYIAFNEENGSYSVRIRKSYYLKANNDGVYSLYIGGNIAPTNSMGYCALPETNSFLYFDNASGSYSIMQYAGDVYKTLSTRYLNGASYAESEGDFVIAGHETAEYDASRFAGLVVTSGYTITAAGGKLTSPARLPSGEIDFMQYGLAEGTRTDASGNEYYHTPSYYILTDLSGNVHKITVGDPIVSGGGYYVRYEGFDGEKFVERQAVYILLDNQTTGYTASYDIFYYYTMSDTVLAPVERLITPMALYPMQQNSYFDVSDFTIMTYNPDRSLENLLNDDPDDDDDYYDITVRFSYYDLSERTNTVNSSFPYVMDVCELYGYTLETNRADECLLALKDMTFVGVSSLSADDDDMVRFGLDIPQYIIYFKSPINGFGSETEQMLSISAMTPNGTYHVYSSYYDMIVEVDKSQLQFLTWKNTEWVSNDVFSHSIGFCDDFKLEAGDYWALFDVEMDRTLTTSLSTSGSSNFTQIVTASDDRSYHLLTLKVSLGANLSSNSVASAEMISVDFGTLRNYYTFAETGKREGMSSTESALLDAFIETVAQSAYRDGTAVTLHSMDFTSSTGQVYNVNVMFTFNPNGEITAAVSVNGETPCLVFSMSAYEKYESLMFSEKLTEEERREALDFYTASNASATATVAYGKVTATNSEGVTAIYSNDKIVTTYPDGTTKTEYCMLNDTKVFFAVEGSDDIIGVGTRWVRRYPVKNDQTSGDNYTEIKDDVYTFNATAVQVITVNGDGTNTTLPGGLKKGKYTVTVNSDMAIVTDESGKEVARYLRYAGTSVFSGVYSGWLWATYEGICEIPEEQKDAFKASDDSSCQAKITVHTKTGETLVYRTYQYSERRSYITVNGEGDFFILRSFVDKLIDTAHLVFDNVYVDADSKYN